MQSPDPQPAQSPLKWIIFIGVTIAIGTSLLFAPPSIQSILFLLILFVSLTLSIQQLLIGAIKLSKFIQQKHQQYPLLHARASFIVALFIIGLATHFYQARYVELNTGFYLFILSFPFVIISFRLLPQPIIPAASDLSSTARIRWHWLIVSIISMMMLTLMNAPSSYYWRLHYDLGITKPSPHLQMLALTIGIITLLMGFGVRLIPRRPTWQRHHWILAGIIMLAAFMRFWDIEHAIRMFMDEFLFIRGIISIELNDIKILQPQANAFSDIFSYLQYLVKLVLGPGLTALRIPAGIFGIMGAVGAYALARQLFSVRVALISALLVAAMPVHVHFSRMGLNNIAAGVIGTWCFVYMLRGMRHGSIADYAIAGVLLGLTHYFYEGGRLFFTPFVLCWLVWMLFFCKKSEVFRFPSVRHLTVLAFSFLMLASPFYYTLTSHNRPLFARVEVTRPPDLTLEQQLSDAVFYSQLTDIGYPIARYVQWTVDDVFYQSVDAFVLPMLVPFFLIGFIYLLWHIRDAGMSLIWWCIVGVAIANSFFIEQYTSSSPRYVLVYSTLMIVAAIGISKTWDLFSRWFEYRLDKLIAGGFLIVLLGTSLYNMDYYFNVNVPMFQENIFNAISSSGSHRPAHDDMILRAMQLPSNTDIHVFTDTDFPGNLRSDIPFFYGREGELWVYHYLVQRLHSDYFLGLPRDRNYVFVTTRDRDYILKDIEQYFTITKIEETPWENIPEDVEMIMYHAPLEANQTLPDGSPLPDVPINTQVRMR